MSNKSEPVAFGRFAADGESLMKYDDEPIVRKNRDEVYNVELFTHPAPALTAELRAELIECLKMGLTAQMYVHGTERKSPNFIKEVYCERQDKIQAAITKLTNLGEAK